MGQQVVTELVIDANTEGANQFSAAMAGAEQAANRGVESVTGLNIGLVALGTGTIAAGVAVKGMLDYVVSANKGLADMQTTAHQVGLTLVDFQSLQFGGAIKGLSTDQINTGLQKSASLLNDASRNSNTLSKELDANGISIKNANGHLISENQLLGIAANLIKNANNPGDQLAIAQMLGFTKEWIPLLEQGAGVMSGLAAQAQAAGAIIDDATIQKASEFDAQWRKSSVEFSFYMKAALSGLLPFFDDIIERSAKWLKSINVAEIERVSNDHLKALADPIGLPDDIAIKITIPQPVLDKWDQLKTKVDDAFTSLSAIADSPKITGLFDSWKAAVPDAVGSLIKGPFKNALNIEVVDPASVPGYAASKITEPTYPTSDQMDSAFDKARPADPGSRARPLKGLSASDYAPDGGSVVAAREVASDPVDRAINTLRRHTEQQMADAKAVGLGDAALAGFRATAAETAAVQANLGKETAAQAADFAKQRDAAIAAADALAKAKVASQIDFGRKTAFLSAEDVSIATQLKGIYGNDIPKALASAEAAALRTNNAMKAVSTSIENNLTSGLTDIVSGTKSVSQGFKDMATSILKDIEQVIIKALIVGPLLRSLGFGGSSIFSSGSLPLPGAGDFIGPVASAHGNIFAGGNVVPFAQGGVVGGPTMAPMALFGESGPEAIVPLRRGSDGNLGIASSGGGGDNTTHVWNINAAGADSGTVERLKSVVIQLSSVVQKQGKAMNSAQRMQATGVG